MKKKYLKPTMEVIKLRSSQTLLAGSEQFRLGDAKEYNDEDGELQ